MQNLHQYNEITVNLQHDGKAAGQLGCLVPKFLEGINKKEEHLRESEKRVLKEFRASSPADDSVEWLTSTILISAQSELDIMQEDEYLARECRLITTQQGITFEQGRTLSSYNIQEDDQISCIVDISRAPSKLQTLVSTVLPKVQSSVTQFSQAASDATYSATSAITLGAQAVQSAVRGHNASSLLAPDGSTGERIDPSLLNNVVDALYDMKDGVVQGVQQVLGQNKSANDRKYQ